MIAAYFDESGHPDQGRALVVSGFVSSVDQWIHFEREWKQTLSDFSAPAIFHTNNFVSGTDGYGSWPHQKRRDFLRRLLGIIRRRILRSFSCAIKLEDFNEVNRELILGEVIGYPYPLAARVCVAKIVQWAKDHNYSDQIEYVFEDGAKHKGQLMYLMERDGKPIPIFKKKSKATPCQAADLLAWSQQNALTKFYGDDQLVDVHEAFEVLATMPNDWAEVSKSDLLGMCNLENVTLRDPGFTYTPKIVRRHGKRETVIIAVPRGHRGRVVTMDVDKRVYDDVPFKNRLYEDSGPETIEGPETTKRF